MKGWVRATLLLASATLASQFVSILSPTPALSVIRWGFLTVFFGLTVAGLFLFLRNAREVKNAHLYTAVSVYVLLGLMFFSLYSVIDTLRPGSLQHSSTGVVRRPSDLLYFSLATLSTVGYGDFVPVNGEVRMLAAVEAMTGVLYVALTVALLVNAYKRHGDSSK